MSQYIGYLLELTGKSLHLSVLWCTVTKCKWMKRLKLEEKEKGRGCEEGRESEGGNGRQEEDYATHTHYPNTPYMQTHPHTCTDTS